MASPRRYASVAMAVLLFATLSVLVFNFAREKELATLRLEFGQQAENRSASVRSAIGRHLEIVDAIGALFDAADPVSRQAFAEFVHPLLARHDDVQALEWIPRVPAAQRGGYEAAARKEGFAGFRLTERAPDGRMVEAGDRPEHFPVYYMEPWRGNEVALGYDLGSHPARRQALEQARDSGAMVATSRIMLVQEVGRQYGYLIFRPVYRKGPPHGTVAERRESLSGYGLGVFRVGDMIEAALMPLLISEVDTYLFDMASPPGERFLYFHPSRSRASQAVPLEEAQIRAGLHKEVALNMPGRKWVLLFAPAPGFYPRHDPRHAYWVLAGGLLFAGLLGFYLSGMIRHEDRLAALNTQLEERVQARTAELAQANRTLVENEARLREADHMKDDIIARVSHELRTPLAGLQGAAELLTQRELPPEKRDVMLRLIERDARRLVELFDSFGEFSRAHAGEYRFQAVEVAPLLEQAVAEASRGDALHRFRIEAGTLPLARADVASVRRVLANLLSNAMKFSPKGGDITVGAQASGSKITIRVSDQGIGIAPEAIPKIFGGLYQEEPPDTRRFGGIGLGLPLARAIVAAHGGRIWVESTPGRGSTFYFTLMRADGDAQG